MSSTVPLLRMLRKITGEEERKCDQAAFPHACPQANGSRCTRICRPDRGHLWESIGGELVYGSFLWKEPAAVPDQETRGLRSPACRRIDTNCRLWLRRSHTRQSGACASYGKPEARALLRLQEGQEQRERFQRVRKSAQRQQ